MKIFLAKWFDIASFSGEMVSSTFIALITLIVFHHFSNKLRSKIVYISIALITSIFIGQGIANSISPSAPIFGLPISVIVSAFFFNSYNLLPLILAAQVTGTVLGFLIYLPYKYVFKADMVAEEKSRDLTKVQIITKELIAQIILASIFIYVSYATFNNGATYVNISPLVTTLISIIAITGLLFIFSKVNLFMISPLLSLILMFRNFKTNKKEVCSLSIQFLIQIIVAVLVGWISMEIKWW